jgi:hypothetical protein
VTTFRPRLTEFWRKIRAIPEATIVNSYPLNVETACSRDEPQPKFPFLPGLFGGTPWSIAPFSNPSLQEDAFSAVRLLRLPWDITFAREHVNRQPPYSPLFVLSLLGTIVAAVQDRRAAFLSTLVAGYVMVFAFLPLDSRSLLPLLPLACIAGAGAIARWKGLSVALSILSVSAGAAHAGWRIARLGPPPTDATQRRVVLEREIPEYRAFSRRDPGKIYVCGAEQLQYFGGGDLLGDAIGPYATERIMAGVHDAGALARSLELLGA